MDLMLLAIPLSAGVLSILYAFYRAAWVRRQDQGSDDLISIGKAIRKGAMAFLAREYRILAVIVIAVGILLALGSRGHRSRRPQRFPSVPSCRGWRVSSA